MKAIAIALLVGLAVGSGVFFLLGYSQGKKSTGRSGSDKSGKQTKKEDKSDDPSPRSSTSKQGKVVPQAEWKRGRAGDGFS